MGLDTEWWLASRTELRQRAPRIRDFADLYEALNAYGHDAYESIRNEYRSDGPLLRHIAFWQMLSPTLLENESGRLTADDVDAALP